MVSCKCHNTRNGFNQIDVVTFLNSGGKIGDTLKAVSSVDTLVRLQGLVDADAKKEVTCDKCMLKQYKNNPRYC